jgi:hypothetical protein
MVGFGGRGLTIYEQAANGDFKAVWDSGSQLEKVQFDNFPVSVHIISYPCVDLHRTPTD